MRAARHLAAQDGRRPPQGFATSLMMAAFAVACIAGALAIAWIG